MQQTKTEWYIIVNPRAGSGRTMSDWAPAEELLGKYGIPYVTAHTTHKGHASELAYNAAGEGYRRLLAVGGDGSLHEVFKGICSWCDDNGAASEDFFLGVAPIGSGNDWIKSLGVPADACAVIELIRKGSFGQMDVVTVCGADGVRSYMANGGGTGFDSHVCIRVNAEKEQGRRSRLMYLKALAATIVGLKANRLKVVTDGKTMFEGECYSIAMGNGRYSGSGLKQVPLADYNDGIMDIMVVPKVSVLTILKEVPRLLCGKIDRSEKIITGRFRKLSIEPLDEVSADCFELDGEIEGRLPVEIDYRERKINIITCDRKGGC